MFEHIMLHWVAPIAIVVLPILYFVVGPIDNWRNPAGQRGHLPKAKR